MAVDSPWWSEQVWDSRTATAEQWVRVGLGRLLLRDMGRAAYGGQDRNGSCWLGGDLRRSSHGSLLKEEDEEKGRKNGKGGSCGKMVKKKS